MLAVLQLNLLTVADQSSKSKKGRLRPTLRLGWSLHRLVRRRQCQALRPMVVDCCDIACTVTCHRCSTDLQNDAAAPNYAASKARDATMMPTGGALRAAMHRRRKISASADVRDPCRVGSADSLVDQRRRLLRRRSLRASRIMVALYGIPSSDVIS